VEDLPARKPATRVSNVTLHMLIVRDEQGRVLLEKRPPAGIWGGLWCLPQGERQADIEARLGSAALRPAALPAFEHRLSHVRMSIQPLLADAMDPRQVQCAASLEWFEPARLPQLGLPKPVTDLLNRLHSGEFD
jgi:A/G-specific adenine glycosylase